MSSGDFDRVIRILQFEKDEHVFVFTYDEDRLDRLMEALHEMADNPEVCFSHFDAATMWEMAQQGDNLLMPCFVCNEPLGIFPYTHTAFCDCGCNERCLHQVCEGCFEQLSEGRFWKGQVHCPLCDHWQTSVIEIPVGQDMPTVPLECANCGLVAAVPE